MQSDNVKGIRRRISIAMMALILTFGLTPGAQAVLFDPDGSGGVPAIDVQTFDWLPANFLAINGATAFQNFNQTTQTCSSPGACNFDVLVSAKLGATLAPGGTPNTPAGIAANTYEITLVARFTEMVTGRVATATSTFAEFATVPTLPGFLEIYFDSTPDAVNVSGSGFNNGDLILRGTTIGNANGDFRTDNASFTSPVIMDQNVTNDYGPNNAPPTACTPGVDQCSVTGSGSQGNIPVDTLITDPAFFLQALALFGVQFANISQGLPFITVDPADCFTPAASGIAVVGGATTGEPPTVCTNLHVDGLMSANAANGGYLPVIGLINGGFAFGGPDFIAQTDFNSTLQAAVPEPSSMLLLGSGLLGIAGFLRQRRKAKQD